MKTAPATSVPQKPLATQSRRIVWRCLACEYKRTSPRIPNVSRTVIKCKGSCLTDTVHEAVG